MAFLYFIVIVSSTWKKLGPLGKGVRLAGHVWGMGRKQNPSPLEIFIFHKHSISKENILMCEFLVFGFFIFPLIFCLVFLVCPTQFLVDLFFF